MVKYLFGHVTTESTSKTINVVASSKTKLVGENQGIPNSPQKTIALTAAVGKMVYLDIEVDNEIFRCLGTVTDIKTHNLMMTSQMESVGAKETAGALPKGEDFRKLTFSIQATFNRPPGETKWKKYSSALPTSPETRTAVYFLDDETVQEMVDEDDIYPTVGFFRGLDTAPQPLAIPDFGGNTGATHSAVIGRSGSGKTATYTYILGTYMCHEHHAIMVIDPQGQWSNENGMVMSLQGMAESLGRPVSVLRVAEDIKLPMDEEIFSRMVSKLNLWKKFRRMGTENLEAFSDAVASGIANLPYSEYDKPPRDLLSKVFGSIANSSSALNRIYTRGDRQDAFRDDLLRLAGLPIIDPDTGEQALVTKEDEEEVEKNWEAILSVFSPLINLFSSTNIDGGKRHSLGGSYGFLKDVFQVRNANSGPAPYVILDMSPSTKIHAAADLMGGKDAGLNMQKILDNQDVKALILMMVLDEMKRASETAFATTNTGNLNTQIVFDEAWRFAPEGKATPEIEELAKKLEGFALDTRKFGIGWSYILQSPADLKTGIWRQLTYVYVGYGLVGDDVKRLEALTDDVKQLDLYRQFIPPKSTGIYPFMLMGPVSPIIFTTAPAFVNVFNNNQDYLHYNSSWINKITERRSMPRITVEKLDPNRRIKTPKQKAVQVEKQYSVGNAKTVSTPQTTIKEPVVSKKIIDDDPDLVEDMPF